MFQNWAGIYDWVREHQRDILRQEAKERAIEAVRRRHREAASRAALFRARGGCTEQEIGAGQAVLSADEGRSGIGAPAEAPPGGVEKRPA